MSPPSSQPAQPMVTDSSVDRFRSTGPDMLETAAANAGIVTVVVAPNASILATAPSPLSLGSSTSSLSPLSSIASPSSVSHNGATFACSSPALTTTPRPSLPAHQQQPAPGKDKNRKKSKSKTQQQKTRTIKFHEYKVGMVSGKRYFRALGLRGMRKSDAVCHRGRSLQGLSQKYREKFFFRIFIADKRTNS